MTLESSFSTADGGNCSLWDDLWRFLFIIVKPMVRFSGVAAWQGQEDEVAEDIALATIERIWKYAQSAERGEVPSIESLKRFSIVVARNYYLDLRRRELRLIRWSQLEYSTEKQNHTYEPVMNDQIDPSELVVDSVFEESLYPIVAQIISDIPECQRRALLVTLANLMDFSLEPTPLQQALLEVGIRIQDYEQPISENPVERRRHAANLHFAFKRLRKLSCEQPAISAR